MTTPAYRGTSAQYRAFHFAGEQFSKQLSAYVAERIDLKLTNHLLACIAVYIPHLLFCGTLALIALNIVPQESVGTLLLIFVGYLIFEVIAITLISQKVNRIQNEGIAFFRTTQMAQINHLRALAQKEYPQENPD